MVTLALPAQRGPPTLRSEPWFSFTFPPIPKVPPFPDNPRFGHEWGVWSTISSQVAAPAQPVSDPMSRTPTVKSPGLALPCAPLGWEGVRVAFRKSWPGGSRGRRPGMLSSYTRKWTWGQPGSLCPSQSHISQSTEQLLSFLSSLSFSQCPPHSPLPSSHFLCLSPQLQPQAWLVLVKGMSSLSAQGTRSNLECAASLGLSFATLKKQHDSMCLLCRSKYNLTVLTCPLCFSEKAV